MVSNETIFPRRYSDEVSSMSILKRIDERTAMMGRMMEAVGVSSFADTGLALESRLRTAFFRCQACRSADECRDWLALHGQATQAPSFCPNAELFLSATGHDEASAP
jgi:hypothetical protein